MGLEDDEPIDWHKYNRKWRRNLYAIQEPRSLLERELVVTTDCVLMPMLHRSNGSERDMRVEELVKGMENGTPELSPWARWYGYLLPDNAFMAHQQLVSATIVEQLHFSVDTERSAFLMDVLVNYPPKFIISYVNAWLLCLTQRDWPDLTRFTDNFILVARMIEHNIFHRTHQKHLDEDKSFKVCVGVAGTQPPTPGCRCGHEWCSIDQRIGAPQAASESELRTDKPPSVRSCKRSLYLTSRCPGRVRKGCIAYG